MTSTVVSGSMGSQVTNLLNTTQNRGTVKESEFKNVLNQTTEQKNDEGTVKKAEVNSIEKKSDVDSTHENNASVDKTPEKTNTSKVENVAREATEEEVSTVAEAVENVVSTITEELDVTKEDVEKAISELGITPIALLNSDILPTVVATITENDDVIAITLDEDLYASLNAISDEVDKTVETITSELNLPVDEFKAAIKSNTEVQDTEAFDLNLVRNNIDKEVVLSEAEDTENIEADDSLELFDKEAVEFTSKASVAEKHIFTKEADTNLEEKISISAKQTVVKTEESTNSFISVDKNSDVKVSETLATADSGFEEETKDDSKQNLNEAPMNFSENLIHKTLEVLTETENEVTYSTYDVENVINQMTEGIEVNLSPETSEINLRLHPESLGNVTVKVSANNEGVLTAKFTAQNESVKAIIESQALVLKETLEAKGVTVEAVEVTVQSHQFERNLSDQGKRGSNSEEEPKKRGIRRINLSETALEELTEDDELTREIMAQNGNSIDYSA